MNGALINTPVLKQWDEWQDIVGGAAHLNIV
jgi:hypothetical protein